LADTSTVAANTTNENLTSDVNRVVERYKESAKWYNENYYAEFEQIHLASKCKTKPIVYKNAQGKEIEDKTRTNVAMPDIAALIHRNTARMTSNPPSMRFICRDNADLAERLSAWAYYQYDRSGESKVQRLHVKQAETFGISYTKLFWDKVVITRPVRFQRDKVTDRNAYLEEQGVSQEQIDQIIQQLGPQMQPEEIAQSILEYGPEMIRHIPTKRYEGPVVRFVFVGDLFCEPGFKSLNDSAWVIEKYIETDRWLDMMAEQTYTDPHSGGEIPIFDAAAVKELKAMDPEPKRQSSQTDAYDLRTRLRQSLNISEPRIAKNLVRGKRFDVLECHEMREDGKNWITWIANESVKLGEMPYIHDLGGRYYYTEYVPMPDLIFGIGDSTPRLGRFLYQLHNITVNQRTDLVNNLLRRVVFRRHGADIPDEAVERSLFRIFDVKDPQDFQVQTEPDVPASAWESEAAIMRQMALLDGVLNNVEAGTSVNPQAGKTATTAVLQQRAVDAMTSAKLSQLNEYLKEVNEKKLIMLQQQLQETLQLPMHYAKSEGMTQRYGKAAAIPIDPYEIQEEIEVEPEAGSTLSVDDEFRRMAGVQLYQLAESDPSVWNKFECAKYLASTIKGADASKLVLQPQPPPPQPPKGTISLAIKFAELPADSQQYILQQMGLPPSQILQSQAVLNHVKHASEAADAAVNLHSPAHPPNATLASLASGGPDANSAAQAEPRRTLADRA
jgi:hypothetical protein